jgi:predicted acetyltransferase
MSTAAATAVPAETMPAGCISQPGSGSGSSASGPGRACGGRTGTRRCGNSLIVLPLELSPVSHNLHVIGELVKGAFRPYCGGPPAGPTAILGGMPELIRPTMTVRKSFLAGERAASAADGTPAAWLDRAAADFGAFVAASRQDREMWGVPMTELWYVSGDVYLGGVAIRHRLTPELLREGGHIGYNVVPEHRRQGHATAILALALVRCRALGLTRALVTCDDSNAGSRRVIEANAGVLADVTDGTCRYWISL